jgi:hypothetical protein
MANRVLHFQKVFDRQFDRSNFRELSLFRFFEIIQIGSHYNINAQMAKWTRKLTAKNARTNSRESTDNNFANNFITPRGGDFISLS